MQRDERIDLSAQKPPRTITRREFVRKLSAAAGSGSLMTAAFTGCALSRSQRAEATEALLDTLGKVPKIKLSKRLGGMEVSRFVLCQDSSRELIVPSIEAGMNYIHKAGYWGGRGGVPEEIKKLPRESYFIDTTVDNTPNDPDNEQSAYDQVTRELERTGFKYFDVFRAHYGWKNRNQFNKGANASYRAFQRLKKEGKVRYFGVSQHADGGEYEPYVAMIQEQIDSGLIDTMQVWLSAATRPFDLAIFEKAHKAGIAITAMKVNAHGAGKVAGDEALQERLKSKGLVHRAALRYVFDLKGSDGKPYVDQAVSRLGNFSQFEENVGSVAAKIALADGFAVNV